ncbi:MAG: hypothetical protein IKW19_08535, partial [Akkermansia sp.]|nr:hypothetical protein [Akkermansia sp.]
TRYNVCNGVRVKWRKLSALQIKIAGVISYRNNARAGSSNVIELTGTLPSFFAELKTETLIYQCFYFAKTAKNAIFGSLPLRSAHNSDKWRFNAWFILFVT